MVTVNMFDEAALCSLLPTEPKPACAHPAAEGLLRLAIAHPITRLGRPVGHPVAHNLGHHLDPHLHLHGRRCVGHCTISHRLRCHCRDCRSCCNNRRCGCRISHRGRCHCRDCRSCFNNRHCGCRISHRG